MTEIQEGNRVVTQITTVKLPPEKQDEVVNLMTERARFMATQPGFVSIALHRSKDGSHVVNYCSGVMQIRSQPHTTRRSSVRNGRNSEKLPTRLSRAFTT